MMDELLNRKSLTRFELAEEVAKINHSNFLLNIFPRVGKSIIAVELIKKWDSQKILILSGATTTNNQWVENITKYNPHLLDRIDIFCYQSLHKIDKKKYDTILLDEFDLVLTNKRISQIYEFKFEHLIGMSGTLESEHIQEFRNLTNNKFYHVKIDFEQAVNWGILPQPTVYAVKLELDNTKPYLLYHASKDKRKKNEIVTFTNRWGSLKNKSVNTLIQCTEFEYHQLITNEFERWKAYEDEFNLPAEERSSTINFLISKGFTQSVCREKKLRVGNERKKFFADIKNRHFKKLFSQLPDTSRVLIFCNDTAQADLLNEQFAVHSNRPESIELVEEFNSFKINKLFACKMLDRGVDFNSIDYLVIIQSSGKQGSQVQRFGRSLLSVAPKIILFYYPKTQDEQYINEFLKQFRSEWIIQKTL